MTTRRTVLKYCGLAATLPLAGCVGESDPSTEAAPVDTGSDGTRTTTPNATADPTTDAPTTNAPTEETTDGLPTNGTEDAGGTRPAGSGGPGITLVGTDESDGPIEHTVEVVEPVATDETPPRLRVTVTNTGDQPVDVGEARTVVFAYVSDTDGYLALLPTGEEYPVEPGCWRLTDPIAVTQEYRVVTLDPGASVEQTLDCYAAPGEDACLPVGEYRFETTFRAGDRTGDTPASETTEHTWGFTVLME
ncbi:hypothetical protein [Halomarina rubra]|uniref:Secreted protein n=1 Tax=Halomarina rubra TaxID=2071873 RepID=A0ABD6AXB5_9EURY|nr:hypothetical protein [Halomarina rubra]